MKFSDRISLQNTAPLLERLQFVAQHPKTPFYTPGHKQGKGIAPQLKQWLGEAVFAADLPELPELDNLFAPQGAIAAAQALAAQAFGADQTWFLANGSTAGIIAAILATCNPGDKLILPRNSHQSAIAGLILSGATPIFINPVYDRDRDLALNVAPEAVEQALNAHPDSKAVFLVNPTYQGICTDLQAIAGIVRDRHLPLIVDEAHGAHFAFHADLPTPALALGADIAIQSTHKVLGAMTQAAMLHCQGDRVNPHRLSQTLQLVQSTSPNYLLLASLDAARQQIATQGQALMAKTLQLSDFARQHIAQIPGLSVLEPPATPLPEFYALDRTRLTVWVDRLGFTGFAADEILNEQLGIVAELPLLRHLTFMITLGNTDADIERLCHAFTTLAARATAPLTLPAFPLLAASPQLAIAPREAFFAATETLAIAQARDRVSAELICPYPPGIPVLLPGEVITETAIAYLQRVLASGGYITGCSDPRLATLNVVR
jgi:arginine decarboxylase